MTEREEALESCPFCGGAAVIEKGALCYYAGCGNDNCQCDSGAAHSTKAEAIARWNRRALKPHAREEALEEAAKAIEAKHTNNVGVVHPIALSDAATIRARASSPPPKGGDEQARSAAPHSAPTEHGNEGHDQ